MGYRVGLGPVFAYEWLTQSRRWQIYAMRSGFGACLLAALGIVWGSSWQSRNSGSLQAYAELGLKFYVGLTGTQIALILLAAPAAAAGAVCLDKQRGALTHLLVTDLSASEIILGKLAARLVPILYLMLSALPIVSLAMLLGGIDPLALLGASLISLGLAVLGCTLALTISVWAARTHEVLLATYTALGLWLLLIPFASGLGLGGSPRGPWSAADWLEYSNPFYLAFMPYLRPGAGNLWGGAVMCLACLTISAILVAFATARLRPVAANPRLPRVKKALPAWSPRDRRRWTSLIPGPSLDGNPVLWREWHRSRPTRITGTVWSIYLGIFALSAVASIISAQGGTRPDIAAAVWTNGLGASIGLLLVSVTASTSLTEERVRGSLDVLLATPLTTRMIVRGKWWGAVRSGLPTAALVLLVAVGLAAGSGTWLAAIILMAYYASLLALIASLGLFAATMMKRPGRAAALTGMMYLLLTVGAFFVVITMTNPRDDSFLGHASPFFAFVITTASCSQRHHPGEWATYYAVPFWTIVWFTLSALLYWLTEREFDRKLGRASILPARSPRREKAFAAPRRSEIALD